MSRASYIAIGAVIAATATPACEQTSPKGNLEAQTSPPGPSDRRPSIAPAVAAALATRMSFDPVPPEERKPNDHVPPADPMAHHDATSVVVPNDGDQGPTRTLKAVAVAGGSPAPTAPADRARLPKVDGEPKPWDCPDKDACAFARMPFYNQTNPNFARVKLPKAVYDADKSKLTGPVVWDDASRGYALVLDPATDKKSDPWYDTWLPYGPVSDKDAGYLGYWYSALAGPTAEAMAVMAALAAKGPGTQPKPGLWVETALVDAKKPDAQEPLPLPLLRDRTTLAPAEQQMTDKDLQRVINIALKEGTSPVGGGGDGVLLQIANDFDPVDGKPAVQTRRDGGKITTSKVLMTDLRDRFVPVIALVAVKASLTPVSQGGKLVKYTLTFASTGGHFLAVDGFSAPAHERPSFLVYDPTYANAERKTILEIPLKGAKKDGVLIEATAPVGDHLAALPVLHDEGAAAPAPIQKLEEITDGMVLTMVGGYTSIRIE